MVDLTDDRVLGDNAGDGEVMPLEEMKKVRKFRWKMRDIRRLRGHFVIKNT